MRSPHPLPRAIYYRDVPTHGRKFRLVLDVGAEARWLWREKYGGREPGECARFLEAQHWWSGKAGCYAWKWGDDAGVCTVGSMRAWAHGLLALNARLRSGL